MKVCNTCNVEKSASEFSKTTYTKSDGNRGVRAYCKTCELAERRLNYQHHRLVIRGRAKKRYASDPKYRDAIKNYSLKQLYGITLSEYDTMRLAQKGRCAICDLHESEIKNNRLYVDHDHENKAIRGLLCNLCNMAIGAFNEDVERIKSAISYIKKHKN